MPDTGALDTAAQVNRRGHRHTHDYRADWQPWHDLNVGLAHRQHIVRRVSTALQSIDG